MASLVHEHLLQKGVHLYPGKAVASFRRTVNGLEVIFKSGERLPADMVLLSIGVRPNTSLATEAGLEIGRCAALGERLLADFQRAYLCGGRRYQVPSS